MTGTEIADRLKARSLDYARELQRLVKQAKEPVHAAWVKVEEAIRKAGTYNDRH